MVPEIQKFGLGFTDELKGANGEVAPWRPIKDGNFIARNFEETSFFGEVRMMAGLRLFSILEAPQWYRNKVDSHENVLKVERSLVELAIRGQADHKKYGVPLANRCYKEYGVMPRFTNWELTMMLLENVPSPNYSPMSGSEMLAEDFLKFIAAGRSPAPDSCVEEVDAPLDD
jgi:hypothetical protein